MSSKSQVNLKRKHCEIRTVNNTSDNESTESKRKLIDLDVADEQLTEYENELTKVETKRSDTKDLFMIEAIRRIEELQNELIEDEINDDVLNTDDEDDGIDLASYEAESLGFAICARETFKFLASIGMNDDNPLVVSLRNRLIGKCGSISI